MNNNIENDSLANNGYFDYNYIVNINTELEVYKLYEDRLTYEDKEKILDNIVSRFNPEFIKYLLEQNGVIANSSLLKSAIEHRQFRNAEELILHGTSLHANNNELIDYFLNSQDKEIKNFIEQCILREVNERIKNANGKSSPELPTRKRFKLFAPFEGTIALSRHKFYNNEENSR